MTLRSPTPLKIAVSCALALVIGVLAAACGTATTPPSGAAAQASDRPISLLFTQSSTHGSLKPASCHCRDLRVLTLGGAAPQTVWFEDRPERHAGQLPGREFANRWTAFGFQADPPNAALALLGGSDDADTVIVELESRPRYDPAAHTIRYVVRLVQRASGKLADFRADQDARVPRHFGAASLFIDTAGARQAPSEQLGPGRWRVDLEPDDAQPERAHPAGAP
jgi:hypothetical protein